MGAGAGVFRRFASTLAVAAAALAIPAAACAGEHRRHHRSLRSGTIPRPTAAGRRVPARLTPPPAASATPEQFFEQAAGHPQVGFTQFIVKHTKPPGRNSRRRTQDRPRRPAGRPQRQPAGDPAVPAGDLRSLSRAPVLPGPQVGNSFVTAALLGIPTPLPELATVYNIVPPGGEPARFGFNLLGNNVYLRAGVAWDGDYHEGFTIDVPKRRRVAAAVRKRRLLKNRLVFDGRSGDGTFITTPSTCFGPASSPFEHVYSTWLLASSVTKKRSRIRIPRRRRPALRVEIPPGTSPKECGSIPFEPSIEVDPNTTQTDSPSGPAVEVDRSRPDRKRRRRTGNLPPEDREGDLAGRDGPQPLGRQRPAGLHRRTVRQGNQEPGGLPGRVSKIGTVSIETPPLPDGSLTGNVYLGQQLSRDPASGQEYRIFVDAESARYGISARLVGNVSADPADRAADHDLRREPAGPVQLLPARLQRRAEGAADQPAHLRAEHDRSQMTHGRPRLARSRRRRRRPSGEPRRTSKASR